MKKIFALFLFLAMFTGCAATHPLAEEWRPLETLVERPGGSNWVTTVGSRIYVGDLNGFLVKNPEGSARFKGLISHELVHSWRQKQLGTVWFYKYAFDREFRLHEELLGYYVEMRLGRIPNLDIAVASLLKYSPSMGTEQQIRDAGQIVFYGEGRPKKSDLPPQLSYLGLD